MTESKNKYSDAQKRASEKYRMNNKDKLNVQRQSYYSKKKRRGSIIFRKKKTKVKRILFKKKELFKTRY